MNWARGNHAAPPFQAWLRETSPAFWIGGLLLVGLAATLPGIWTIAGLAGILVVILILAWPDAAVYLLALSVPLGSLLELGGEDQSQSLTISPTEGLVALLLVGWAARALTRRRLAIPVTPLLVPLLVMLAAVVFSSQHATAFSLSIKETLKWVELLVVYLYVVAEMGTLRQVGTLLGFLFAAALIEDFIGLGQFVLGIGPETFAIGRFMRAYGTFEQPNPYAGYLGMLLPLMIAFLLARPGRRARNAAGVVLLLTTAAIGASLSRGAWVGIGLAVAAMMLFWSRRSRLLLAGSLIAATPLGALAFLNMLPAELTTRLATGLDYFRFIDVTQEIPTPDNWAVLERVAHWQAALNMIVANPVFGVGAGNYPAVYEQYMVPGWIEALGHAHNYYLNVAAEMGLSGLGIYLVLLAVAFLSVIRWLLVRGTVRVGGGWARAVLLGVLGALVATSVHNMFDNLFVHGMGIQIGMVLAMAQVAATSLSGTVSDRGRVTP